ncbi:unnamed protein product, partial [Tetraodon nigroviridis]
QNTRLDPEEYFTKQERIGKGSIWGGLQRHQQPHQGGGGD